MIEGTIRTNQHPYWGTTTIEETPDTRTRDSLPSLEEVLASEADLPTLSLLLGLGEDGRPLVLDLEDPDASAFLIASDDGFDNTALLHSIVTAALKGNHPNDLLVHLISPHADDLLNFHHQPHFRLSYTPFHPGTPIVIEELVNLVVSRQGDTVPGSCQILGIDGLDLLWQALPPQARLNMDWLIRNGPAAGLWVIATVESTYLADSLTSAISLFPSRILGQVSQPNLARYLSGLGRSYLADLIPGQEFLLLTGIQAITLQMLYSEDLTGV